jgi:circadian clock protein KaiB
MSATEPGATADQPGPDANPPGATTNQPGAATNKGSPYVLRLFITGTTSRSARAIANLRRVCEQRLHGEYDLEVIDIYQHPAAAREYQIVAAPTLVKMLPLPLRRIIGDLANEERILAGLDLVPVNGTTIGR